MITSVGVLITALIIWLIWAVVVSTVVVGVLMLLDGYESSCLGMLAILLTWSLYSVLVFLPIGVIIGSALKHLV